MGDLGWVFLGSTVTLLAVVVVLLKSGAKLTLLTYEATKIVVPAEQEDWRTAWGVLVPLKGDSLAMSTARKALGTYDAALTTTGIPHSQEVYTIPDAEALAALDTRGVDHVSRPEIFSAETLDAGSCMLFRIRVDATDLSRAEQQIAAIHERLAIPASR